MSDKPSPKSCSVPDCKGKLRARGMCAAHYSAAYNDGKFATPANKDGVDVPQDLKRNEKGHFGVGNTGKKMGARLKLSESFVTALYDDFEKDGVAAIAAMRKESPVDYVRVVASLLPKEFKIETTSDLTDDQLNARIRQLAAVIGVEIGIGGASDGTSEADGPQPARGLSTLQ